MTRKKRGETGPEVEPEAEFEGPETDMELSRAETSGMEAEAEDAPEAESVQDAPSGGPVRLQARARVEETEALLAELRALPQDAPLEFDASAVENVSTPYILAIVGAARARAEAGAAVAVRSPSPAFVDAFSDLGLFGDLMKMEIRS